MRKPEKVVSLGKFDDIVELFVGTQTLAEINLLVQTIVPQAFKIKYQKQLIGQVGVVLRLH